MAQAAFELVTLRAMFSPCVQPPHSRVFSRKPFQGRDDGLILGSCVRWTMAGKLGACM